MYDFAHPIEDAHEGTTHSICTLEFEDHRPLYDWVVNNCGFTDPKPKQIEFARLNITNTIMSKRFLKRLVDEGKVESWDDPRMPTLCGLRRRGYPAEALRDFCERIGVSKAGSEVESSYLEACVRSNLNFTADRAMVVTNPIKVTLKGLEDCDLETEINPNMPEKGNRKLTISETVYIDGSDFALVPPPKYHRLKPDGYVRLKGAYIIHCDEVITEGDEVKELICSIVPNSKSSNDTSGMKVKGVIQWVNGSDCVKLRLRKIQSLLLPGEGDFITRMNDNSMTIVDALGEAALRDATVGERFQFMRMGYYVKDRLSNDEADVYNEIVGLKDSFNK